MANYHFKMVESDVIEIDVAGAPLVRYDLLSLNLRLIQARDSAEKYPGIGWEDEVEVLTNATLFAGQNRGKQN